MLLGDFMLIDTHCHVYKEYYDNILDLMNKISLSEVDFIINNACNFNTCEEVLELSNIYENMFCVLGLQPQENLDELDDIISLIEKNVYNKKVVGIGEIGLDYYYGKENRNKQIKVFERQMEIAEKYKLPVIIHSRDATKDTIDILKKYKVRGIIHCFSGSLEVAKEYIKLGYKLGINGIVTFKNCKLIDVLRNLSIGDIVFETDSPYLTPVPFRGEINDPTYVSLVVKFLSDELNIKYDELIDISYKNVKNIFGI